MASLSVEDVWAALDAGDVGKADTLIERLLPVAQEGGETIDMAAASFALGMVRDRQDRLEEAEAAFAEAVGHDEQAHGEEHRAVADALRSLALVQSRRGPDRMEQAKRSLERAAGIYEDDDLAAAADVLIMLGELTFADDCDAAEEHFRKAELLAVQSVGPLSFEAMCARNRRAEVLCKRESYRDAFEVYMQSSRRLDEQMSARARDELGWAWFQLGALSKAWHAFTEAALAWSASAKLGGPASRHARERLTGLPESFEFEPLSAWRLTHYSQDTGGGHVAHPDRGLYTFEGPCPVEIGEQVTVEIVDGQAKVSAPS